MKKTHYWGVSLLILSTIVLPTSISPKIYREILFILVAIGSLALFKGKKGFIASPLIPLALITLPYNGWAFTNITMLLLGLCLVSHLQTGINWGVLKIYGAGLLAIQCLAILLQHNGIDHASLWGLTRKVIDVSQYKSFPVVGLLEHHMTSGSLLAMTVPFAFTRRFWPLLVPAIVALYLLGSAMAWFSVLGCMLFFVSKIKSTKLLMAATILICVLVAGCLYIFWGAPIPCRR